MNYQEYKNKLKKQGYRFLGNHSALKLCSWTKKSILNKGECYKQKFYNIKSHRCAQISCTVNFCNFNCELCWREHYNFKIKETDQPKEILKNIPKAQFNLISGLKGNKLCNINKFKEATDPQHIAISLTGETLYYPKLNQLIKEIKKQNKTSFIVTNGSQPEILKSLQPPTQLYISLDAPNKNIFLKVNKPMKKDSWKDLMSSLEILKKLKSKTRTALRITLVKGLNMLEPENYAKLIEKADPHFIEVKAYMLVGASRNRLRIENMPRHHEVKEFTKKICKFNNYKIIDEQPESRVVLIMKKDFPERMLTFK